MRRTNDAGYVGGEGSLGRNPGHELLEERSGPRGTRDLERNRAVVGLHCHDEAEEATAAALRVDDGRNCGEEIVRRREAPAIAVGNGDALYRAGEQARQQSGAAFLKLSGGEGAGDRKVGHVAISFLLKLCHAGSRHVDGAAKPRVHVLGRKYSL